MKHIETLLILSYMLDAHEYFILLPDADDSSGQVIHLLFTNSVMRIV